MKGTPGLIVVPGETCTRPFGCSIVIGSIQIQEPSSFRQKAFRTSRSVIGSPRSHLHHRLIARRFQPRREEKVRFCLTALCAVPNRPAVARKASIPAHVVRHAVREGFSPRHRNAGRRRAARASARRSRHRYRSLGHRPRASTRKRVPESDRRRLSPVGAPTALQKSRLLERPHPWLATIPTPGLSFVRSRRSAASSVSQMLWEHP